MLADQRYQEAVGLRSEGNRAVVFDRLRNAVALYPDHGEAHYLLGVMYLEDRETDRAEHHLLEAIRVGSNPAYGESDELEAKAQNVLGTLRIAQERFDDAVVLLRAAAADESYRTPAYAWANLGLAYFGQRDYEAARQAELEAIRRDPSLCVAYLTLGRALSALEDWEHTEEALTRLLEFRDRACNSQQEAWALRGEARARLGHAEDATADLERCVELGAETAIGARCQTALDALH